MQITICPFRQTPAVNSADLLVHQPLVTVDMDSAETIRLGREKAGLRSSFFEPDSMRVAADYGMHKITEPRGSFLARHHFLTNLGTPFAGGVSTC
jgi:hypothetical protein